MTAPIFELLYASEELKPYLQTTQPHIKLRAYEFGLADDAPIKPYPWFGKTLLAHRRIILIVQQSPITSQFKLIFTLIHLMTCSQLKMRQDVR